MPGRGLAQIIFSPETCSVCTQRGRKRIHEHAFDTYHEFMANKGSEFEKPDLCIAFNSGASQASMHMWPPTFKLLVERKITGVLWLPDVIAIKNGMIETRFWKLELRISDLVTYIILSLTLYL
ncbi:hypothetical protein C8J57DRAFT_1535695 [Mycena rebaudengoi]|nr:hypothetical protein C8J57DRAFT_1535695 [Mycena rebaudengoi]